MGKEPLFTHKTTHWLGQATAHTAVIQLFWFYLYWRPPVNPGYIMYTATHLIILTFVTIAITHNYNTNKEVGEQAYHNYNCEQTRMFQMKQEIQTATPTRANKNMTMQPTELTRFLTESHFSLTCWGALSAPAASDGDVQCAAVHSNKSGMNRLWFYHTMHGSSLEWCDPGHFSSTSESEDLVGAGLSKAREIQSQWETTSFQTNNRGLMQLARKGKCEDLDRAVNPRQSGHLGA